MEYTFFIYLAGNVDYIGTSSVYAKILGAIVVVIVWQLDV